MVVERKICVVTGSRAEYGLLYWIMHNIREANDLTLQLVVTGMHLSSEFGLTYQQIEKDGFSISRKAEILVSSDTPVGIAKSMGLGMIEFGTIFESLRPDIILMLGDRFELLAAASAAKKKVEKKRKKRIDIVSAEEEISTEPSVPGKKPVSPILFTTRKKVKSFQKRVRKVIESKGDKARLLVELPSSGLPGSGVNTDVELHGLPISGEDAK